jgi:hypothetical protein
MMTSVALCLLAIAAAVPATPPAGSSDLPAPVALQSSWFDCGSDGDCAEGQFCRFPRGECGGDGTCTDRPEVCGFEYQPVCGCDGETYTNTCEALSEGVSIDYLGDC